MIVYLQTDDKRLEHLIRAELDWLICQDSEYAMLTYTVEYDLDTTWIDTTAEALGAQVVMLINRIREDMDAKS